MTWEERGRYFGYPECCICAFVDTLGAMGASRARVGATTQGFVPCEEHARQILGGASVESLLRNRACPTAFPQETYKREAA